VTDDLPLFVLVSLLCRFTKSKVPLLKEITDARHVSVHPTTLRVYL
jgi:hypothetical protein